MSILTPIRKIAGVLRTHPFLGRMALYCIPDIRRQIEIQPIGPFLIRLRRNRSYWLRHPLAHETVPLAALSRVLRPGNVIFDIGANIGMYTRFMAGTFAASKVYSFEPMTQNREMLLQNVALGGVGDRVTVLPFALSDKNESAAFQVDDMQTGSAALDSVRQGKPSEGRAALGLQPKTETVACRTLDSLIADGTLPRPDVLKIDIEGAERMMLEGAAETLKTAGPRMMIELHGAAVSRDVTGFLLSHGYHLRGVGQIYGDADQGPITTDLIPRIQNQYDLHFLLASKEPSDVSTRIDPGSLSFLPQ